MKSLILLAVLLAIVAPAIGRVFTRCELARELHYEHNFMRENLDDWVCLVEFESRFNTSAIYGPNTNGSFDWGLFQINDGWWCTVGSPGKDCNIDCNSKCVMNLLRTYFVVLKIVF